IMETGPGFSFAAKAEADKANPEVQEWEALMWRYQQAIPGSSPGEKWRLMDQIFVL
ncbi:MAG: L-rhamnose mutarotase, partial [Dinghuibacter sp.]|nr:L-rhamnose mutarotase [Dinghuibacter sp.]